MHSCVVSRRVYKSIRFREQDHEQDWSIDWSRKLDREKAVFFFGSNSQ